MASKGASTSLDHWADIRQAAQDEANDSTECQCGCGKEASRADGWYLANGAGPYRDECYERLAEPEDASDD